MNRFKREITWNEFLAYLSSSKVTSSNDRAQFFFCLVVKINLSISSFKVDSLQVYTNNRVYVKMNKTGPSNSQVRHVCPNPSMITLKHVYMSRLHHRTSDPFLQKFFRIGSITAFESNLAHVQRQPDGSALLSPVPVIYKNYSRPWVAIMCSQLHHVRVARCSGSQRTFVVQAISCVDVRCCCCSKYGSCAYVLVSKNPWNCWVQVGHFSLCISTRIKATALVSCCSDPPSWHALRASELRSGGGLRSS